MSSGERPIGAAKGKQSDTEALCQPPPPLPKNRRKCRRWGHSVLSVPTIDPKEPPCIRTTTWSHGSFPDTIFFLQRTGFPWMWISRLSPETETP